MSRRHVIAVAAAGVLVLAAVVLWNTRAQVPPGGMDRVVITLRSGDLDIVVLADGGVLRQGRSQFDIEFRREGTSTLVDAGAVTASATMTMPGMVMPGNVRVQRTAVPGRYAATAEFGMAGAWQMSIGWDGAAGRGSVSFEGNVE